jgi:adenylate kinase family enzyme
MQSNLTITVAGISGAGKTTLAREIAQALAMCGFPVQHCDTDKPVAREVQMKRLEDIKARLVRECATILVKEEATRRVA